MAIESGPYIKNGRNTVSLICDHCVSISSPTPYKWEASEVSAASLVTRFGSHLSNTCIAAGAAAYVGNVKAV